MCCERAHEQTKAQRARANVRQKPTEKQTLELIAMASGNPIEENKVGIYRNLMGNKRSVIHSFGNAAKLLDIISLFTSPEFRTRG